MKDTELRAIVLRYFYDRRQKGRRYPTEGDFDPPLPLVDIDRIADQLHQHGLIELETTRNHTGSGRLFGAAMGSISAAGIDVVEKIAAPPLPMEWPRSQHVTIVDSNGVVVGNNNLLVSIGQALVNLHQAIDAADASAADNAEAKNRLRQLLEHPLVAAIAGAAATAILGG
ncbi:MAG: hypothetical protein ACK5TK_00360 [Betaproteobacteria bacterium]